MTINTAERRLAPFPDAPSDEITISATDCLQTFIQAESKGHIIYGGPGSGSTTLLKFWTDQLHASNGRLPLGPYNMSLHAGQSNPELVWRDLAHQIIASLALAQDSPQTITHHWDPDLTTTAVLELVGDHLQTVAQNGIERMILLLDDFDDVHPRVAVNLANQLRALFDTHKQYFSFVLMAESDLEMLRTTRHVYSPLEGVSLSLQLLDLNEAETNIHARDFYQGPGNLTATDLEELWVWTRGYPALINKFLDTLATGRKERLDFSIQEAKDICQDNYAQVEPLRTAVREIDELANLNVHGLNPAQLIHGLLRGELPSSTDDRGERMLLAMGILGWRGTEVPTWRNEFVRTFWSQHPAGERHLLQWIKRPSWYQQSELSAQGKIYVNLFLDLEFFLRKGNFNRKRGTTDWVDALCTLPEVLKPTGPFELWKEQKRLINIGSDLNIFRTNTIKKSFMPIYSAQTRDFETRLQAVCERLLNRLDNGMNAENRKRAGEVLQEEWRRWQQVRLQLTRDGAIHITLEREINDPLPLMQIMRELLGLEKELEGSQIAELSVQWELALIAVIVFFEQICAQDGSVPQLDVQWHQMNPKDLPTPQDIYPLRDRYVIYMLQKVCNCRFQGLRPLRERRIINMEDLDDLLHQNQIIRDAPDSDQNIGKLQSAFNYARELSTLLEGVMIGRVNKDNPEERTGDFPPLTLHEIKDFLESDLSSWRNEYAGTTLDNALFVFQTQRKLLDDGRFARPSATKTTNATKHDNAGESSLDDWCRVCEQWEHRDIEDIYFPQRTVAYADYWYCLSIGLTYVIELRWSAQWIAWHTTDWLDRLAGYREKFGIGLPDKEFEELVDAVALTTRLLAHLRDATTPMFMAGADYAVRKYQHLVETSNLAQAIKNSEENIAALNTYLNYVEQQQMQQTSENNAKVVGCVGGLLAILTLCVALPSMWIDFGAETNIGEALFSWFVIIGQKYLKFPLFEKSQVLSYQQIMENSFEYTFLTGITFILIFIVIAAGCLSWWQIRHKRSKISE
ncbi:MAG: ATP-binding protein [Anaerolineales bacterium]|nr:ATP-binding protein [Anaerolineales bacterium]